MTTRSMHLLLLCNNCLNDKNLQVVKRALCSAFCFVGFTQYTYGVDIYNMMHVQDVFVYTV